MSEQVQEQIKIEDNDAFDWAKGEQIRKKRKNYTRGWKIFFYVLMALFIVIFISVTCAIYASLATLKNNTNPSFIENMSITRYLGSWYEIARLPVTFESGCANVVATYSLDDNGTLKVSNTCDYLGELTTVVGKAKAVGTVDWNGSDMVLSPGQIKVAFYKDFYGPYWIIDLDTTDYLWAMIGNPNRQNLWILSRTKIMDPAVYSNLVEKARQLNYPIWNLQLTVQV